MKWTWEEMRKKVIDTYQSGPKSFCISFHWTTDCIETSKELHAFLDSDKVSVLVPIVPLLEKNQAKWDRRDSCKKNHWRNLS